MGHEPAGVIICGLFGTGKSSAAEEIATRLERQGLPYAAIDLDWLAWFDAGGDHRQAERVVLDNIRAVVGNYLDAGVRFFVMAGFFQNQAEVDELRQTVPFPLTVIELVAPWPEIERRLRSSPTAGRLDDLRDARAWVEAGENGPTADATIDGDRPIDQVAGEILDVLGWIG